MHLFWVGEHRIFQCLGAQNPPGGYLGLQSKDSSQAFILARTFQKRARKAFVLQSVEQQTRKVTASHGIKNQFLLVPRKNFDGALPKVVAENVVPTAELALLEGGEDINFEDFYVVDMVVPREACGQRCRVVEFKMNQSAQDRAAHQREKHADK